MLYQKRYSRVVNFYVSSLSWTIFFHNRKMKERTERSSWVRIEIYIFLSGISSSSYFRRKVDRSGQSTHVTRSSIACRPWPVSQNNIIKSRDPRLDEALIRVVSNFDNDLVQATRNFCLRNVMYRFFPQINI